MQKSHEVLQLACLVAILAVLVCILPHLNRPVSPETFRLPMGAEPRPTRSLKFDDGRRPVGAQIDRAVGSE